MIQWRSGGGSDGPGAPELLQMPWARVGGNRGLRSRQSRATVGELLGTFSVVITGNAGGVAARPDVVLIHVLKP